LLLALAGYPACGRSAARLWSPTSRRMQPELARYIDENTPRLEQPEPDVQPTLGFQRVLQRAVFHVQSSGHKEVTAVNVLVAIFGEKESHAVYLLTRQGISRLDIVNYISHGISRIHEDEAPASAAEAGEDESEAGAKAGKSALEMYASNLNQRAKEGRIDPLIGREHEIERTIQVLCRRRKNNPLFVGEAGVGKTALAEGLALLIVEDRVPEILRDSCIYALDMGALIAGTKYRGDFENASRA